jgi:hypothetical protein
MTTKDSHRRVARTTLTIAALFTGIALPRLPPRAPTTKTPVPPMSPDA